MDGNRIFSNYVSVSVEMILHMDYIRLCNFEFGMEGYNNPSLQCWTILALPGYRLFGQAACLCVILTIYQCLWASLLMFRNFHSVLESGSVSAITSSTVFSWPFSSENIWCLFQPFKLSFHSFNWYFKFLSYCLSAGF